MKKLMIAAAIVCAAVASQAATVVWNSIGGDTIYDGDATTVVADVTPVYLILSTYSQSDLIAAYQSNKGSASAAILAAGGAKLDEGYTMDGMAMTDNMPTYSSLSFDAYLAIVDDDKIYVSTTATAAWDGVDPDSTYLYFTDMAASQNAAGSAESYKGAGWYTYEDDPGGDVPEPTSGLLIALGMATLALRRRRA